MYEVLSDREYWLLSRENRYLKDAQKILIKVRQQGKGKCSRCSNSQGNDVFFHTKKYVGDDLLHLVNQNRHESNCPLYTHPDGSSPQGPHPTKGRDGKPTKPKSISLVSQVSSGKKNNKGGGSSGGGNGTKKESSYNSLNLLIRGLLEEAYLHNVGMYELDDQSQFGAKTHLHKILKPAEEVLTGKNSSLKNKISIGLQSLDYIYKYFEKFVDNKFRPYKMCWFTFDNISETDSGYLVTSNDGSYSLPHISKMICNYPNTTGTRIGVAIITTNVDNNAPEITRFWSYPIVSHELPILVDSHYERLMAIILTKLVSSQKISSWSKPLLGEFCQGTYVIPDFFVKKMDPNDPSEQPYAKRIILELMGDAFGVDEYRERKSRTVKMMKKIFKSRLIEISVNRSSQLDPSSDLITNDINNRITKEFDEYFKNIAKRRIK